VLNFSADTITYSIPGSLKAGELQISNLGKTAEQNASVLHLKGWDARVCKL
jgi:hypothetical protein